MMLTSELITFLPNVTAYHPELSPAITSDDNILRQRQRGRNGRQGGEKRK
jgi:hypothetical protein